MRGEEKKSWKRGRAAYAENINIEKGRWGCLWAKVTLVFISLCGYMRTHARPLTQKPKKRQMNTGTHVLCLYRSPVKVVVRTSISVQSVDQSKPVPEKGEQQWALFTVSRQSRASEGFDSKRQSVLCPLRTTYEIPIAHLRKKSGLRSRSGGHRQHRAESGGWASSSAALPRYRVIFGYCHRMLPRAFPRAD